MVGWSKCSDAESVSDGSGGARVVKGSRVPVQAIIECGGYGSLISAIIFCASMNYAMGVEQYQSHPVKITSKEFFANGR
jgi:hypothetical protein